MLTHVLLNLINSVKFRNLRESERHLRVEQRILHSYICFKTQQENIKHFVSFSDVFVTNLYLSPFLKIFIVTLFLLYIISITNIIKKY